MVKLSDYVCEPIRHAELKNSIKRLNDLFILYEFWDDFIVGQSINSHIIC